MQSGAAELVASALRGVHSTIFAYGQTGSGKTYTMQGPHVHRSPPTCVDEQDTRFAMLLVTLRMTVTRKRIPSRDVMQWNSAKVYQETVQTVSQGPDI
jgi:hypothetical protein